MAKILVLRRERSIEAFLLFREDYHGAFFPFVVGYDTSEVGSKAYRTLWGWLLRQSRATGKSVFLSSGAAEFKRNRGTVSHWELEAVSYGHLPVRCQLFWRTLIPLVNFWGPRLYQAGAI